jgi:cytochrome c553
MRSLRLTLASALFGLSAAAVAAGPVTGDAKAGRNKTAMCEGCHGIPGWRTAYPDVYSVPKLGGQYPQYIIAALKEYQSGQRSHPSMQAIASGLTEQDMADIAAYYGGPASPTNR